MIIEITGKPRAGKTALNTLFMALEEKYFGRAMQRDCAEFISNINKSRKNKIIIPDKAPICANYEAEFVTGYKKTFKPYFVNPYHLGLSTPQTAEEIQQILPYSRLHITEGRKYWDGRESSSMPDNVSQFFETHGHNYMTIIIDVQRGKALDLNIRENVTLFIEVQGMVNKYDAYGRVISSTWYCREFHSLQDYEAYLAGKTSYYRNTTYYYEGNIFECFKSRNRQEDYIPAEGKQYSMLEFVTKEEIEKLPEEVKKHYDMRRPKWFRMKNAA